MIVGSSRLVLTVAFPFLAAAVTIAAPILKGVGPTNAYAEIQRTQADARARYNSRRALRPAPGIDSGSTAASRRSSRRNSSPGTDRTSPLRQAPLRQDRAYQPPRLKRDRLDRSPRLPSERRYYQRRRMTPGIDCDWLRLRAIRTGERYWWNRYRSCVSAY